MMKNTDMIRLFLYIIDILMLSKCQICNKQRINYKIGQNVTILDIQSEEISQLRAPCTEEIAIPDALFGVIYVEKAEYSGNNGFIAQANGMVSKTYKDTAFISRSCENDRAGRNWSRQITQGLEIFNISDSVCVTFKPELNHRSLGYHVRGGKIKISLKVNFAYCNLNNTNVLRQKTGIRTRREVCRPICSVYGIVSPCEETTIFRQRTTTTRSQTSTRSLTDLQTSKQPMTYPNFVPFVHGNNALPLPGVNSTVTQRTTPKTIGHSLNSLTKTSQKSSNANTLFTTIVLEKTRLENQSYQSSQLSMRVLSKSTKISKTTQGIPYSIKPTNEVFKFQTSEVLDGETTRDGTVSSEKRFDALTTQRTGDHDQIDLYQSSIRTDRAPIDWSSSKTFGLIEGLYILVGCLVVFVIFFTSIYCIRFRNKSGVVLPPNNRQARQQGPTLISDSSYMSRWRDNWLIRYHNTENDDDVQSVFDDNIDQIRDGSVRSANQENFNAYPIRNGSHNSTYHDPWPLIRLDSDFVRNTKSLERLPSNKSSDIGRRSLVKHILTQKVSKASSDSGIGGKESVENGYSSVKIKTQSLKDKTESGKERFRYIKRVNSHLRSRGSYNVSKAQRSASLSNYDFVRGQLQESENIEGKYTPRDQVNSKREHNYNDIPDIQPTDSTPSEDLKPSRRQRNTSSMCSGSSITFEEMVEEETMKCEDLHTNLRNRAVEINNRDSYVDNSVEKDPTGNAVKVEPDKNKLDRERITDDIGTSVENVTPGADFPTCTAKNIDKNTKIDTVVEDLVAKKYIYNAEEFQRYEMTTDTSHEANDNQEETTHGENVVNNTYISIERNDSFSKQKGSRKYQTGTRVNASIPTNVFVSSKGHEKMRQQERGFTAIGTIQFPK